MNRSMTSLLVVASLLAVAGCGGDEPEAQSTTPTSATAAPEETSDDTDEATTTASEVAPATATPTEEPAPAEEAAPPLAPLEVVAQGLQVPWGLAVLPDGDALVGERDTAEVWRVSLSGDRERVTTIPGVEPDGEGGLLGLVVPPGGDGSELYVYATTAEDNRVLRVDLASGDEPQVEVVLDGIPKAGNHNGGRLAFGPDDYLYVTTGDASDLGTSQDPGSLGGKILRITADGEPAPGNPDPGSPVWSLGHRNVQGLGWDSQGRMWASEFGQNALDELNLIEPGGNYGWPQVEGPGGAPDFIDPVVTWRTDEASPSGLAVGPDDAVYVAALRGQALWRVEVDDAGRAGEPERLLTDYGRLRSVVTDDAGALWVLTSNTFRGDPAPDDDRLLRLDPETLRR